MDSINIPNIGTMFPNYFSERNDPIDYYKAFLEYHTPQSLTESNKGDVAFRKGIYMTEVSKDLEFKLLRCSSNLQGPTDNFSDIDRSIIKKVNETSKELFANPADLNHVLAQVYYNDKIDGKERKAKIARHSDKTKDMPENGVMVFCTFYDQDILSDKSKYHMDPANHYNIMYGKTTALTTLRFVRKNDDEKLPEKVDVLLYPDSAFFMSLDTNRLYTHEIVPPTLQPKDIPTRLGYVIRCSKQDAKFEDGKVLIKKPDSTWEPMQPPTSEGVEKLKKLYRDENMSTEVIDYDYFNFSLNEGDYLAPNPHL